MSDTTAHGLFDTNTAANAAANTQSGGTGGNSGGTQTVVVANGPLTYAAPASGSVGTSNAPLVAAGTYTNLIIITTAPTSAGNVFLGLGSAAAVGSGFCVPAGGGSFTFSKTGPVPLPASGQAINAISDSGTVAVSIQGA